MAETYGYFKVKEAGVIVQYAAVKDMLADEHKLYCQAFAKSIVNHQWDSHIL
jgi:hypothetical protein